MGDPKRLNSLYDVPRMKWNKQRILADRKIMDEYGLTKKKELWKAETVVRNWRKRARLLLAGRTDNFEQRKAELMNKLIKLGIFTKENKIEDVLKLSLSDILDRRLETIAFKQGLAVTIKQARQLITHGHVALNGKKRTIPGSLVMVGDVVSYNNIRIKAVIDQTVEAKGKPVFKSKKEEKVNPKAEINKEDSDDGSKDEE